MTGVDRATRPVNRPAPAVLELDGVRLEPLMPGHAAAVVELHRRPWNAASVEVPDSVDACAEMLNALRSQVFAVPLLAISDGRIIATLTTALAAQRHLNAYFVALFDDHPQAGLALAMHVRHVFWSLPLHRLHCQVPDVPAADRYLGMLDSIGFRREGTLSDHLMVGGEPCDVIAFGLLRSDAVRWARDIEPRLALGDSGNGR